MIPAHIEGAERFDCNDSDVGELSATSPWEAFESYVERFLSPGCDTAAVIAEHAPFTVTGYFRAVVPESWSRSCAADLVRHAAEMFDDEFGNPDDHDDSELDTAGLATKLQPLLVEFFNGGRVWRCEPVGFVELDAEAALAWARTERPDWFEP